MNIDIFKKTGIIIIMFFCVWPRIDAAMALIAGIIFSLVFTNPFEKKTSRWSKILLQISVVGLGFGVGIGQVLHEAKDSIFYTIVGIAVTLTIGSILGTYLKVNSNTSQLISFGTAICGGSAIAAMAPLLKAKNEEIAVSLTTVFMLNSLALLLFPFIGHLLNLDQRSFGLWSALAIHDTSSVVGAASNYGDVALGIATTVKLTRAIWIMPVVLLFAFFKKSDGKSKFPFFIAGFIIAALIRSLFPNQQHIWSGLAFTARRLLVITLFLVGLGLSRDVLKKVGIKPMVHGILLWIFVSTATLAVIVRKIIY